MSVAKVRWWMWFAGAVAIGLLVGGVRQSTADFEDQLDAYGTYIADQHRLEDSLTQEINGIRQLRDVRVYPCRPPSRNGGRRLVHVVTGYYWNGEATFVNGQVEARFKPVCYLAQVPYTSVTALDAGGAGKQFPDVMAYLDSLRATNGVKYRYVWWGWATAPLFLWTVGCTLVIGVLWPAFINLMTSGSLLRPKEKGVSLLHVRSNHPTPTPKPTPHPDPAGIEQEVETQLVSGPAREQAAAPAAPGPRVLTTTPLEPTAPAAAGSDKAFGADKDDFYPTEIHPPAKGKADPKK